MQYNPDFLVARAVVPTDALSRIAAVETRYPLNEFLADARNFEEATVDFVYTSAKIEGNTYDRLDTDNLLRLGITAGGKKHSDAIMLVNLRTAFDWVMNRAHDPAPITLDVVCELHKILMRDLLPVHEQGIVRQTGVLIGATNYRPLADAGRLRTEMSAMLDAASTIVDPVARAIYLHCNAAYLQYFRDGNKRTARMLQTLALVQAGRLPLFFADTLIDRYQRATVTYYETGAFDSYVAFYEENFSLAVERFVG